MHKMLGAENGFEVKFCDKKNCPKFWWFKNNTYLCIAIAKIAQLVEHNLAKVGVAGSSPVFRSNFFAVSFQRLILVRVVELVDTLL